MKEVYRGSSLYKGHVLFLLDSDAVHNKLKSPWTSHNSIISINSSGLY